MPEEQEYNEMYELYIRKDFEGAIAMGEANIDNEFYRALLMRTYVAVGRINEAIEIGLDPRFHDSEAVQSQLMKAYIENKTTKLADAIGNRPEFKDSELIQKRVMELHVIRKEYNEAEEIFNKYPEYSMEIHMFLVRKFMEFGLYDRAERLGEDPRCKYVPEVQSYVMTALIRQRRFAEAVALSETEVDGKEIFYNNKFVQSQAIKAHCKLRQLRKAVEIGERFPDVEMIQCQVIPLYAFKGDVKKVEEITSRFPGNQRIQSCARKHIARYRDYIKKSDAKHQIEDNRVESEGPNPEEMVKSVLKSFNDPEFISKINSLPFIQRKILEAAVLDARKSDSKTKKGLAQRIETEYKSDERYLVYEKIIKRLINKLKESSKGFLNFEFYINQLKLADSIGILEDRSNALKLFDEINSGAVSEADFATRIRKEPQMVCNILAAAQFSKTKDVTRKKQAIYVIQNNIGLNSMNASKKEVYLELLEQLDKEEYDRDSFERLLMRSIEIEKESNHIGRDE